MSIKSDTFLNNIDTIKVNTLLNQTDINADYFTTITNKVISSYTQDLDNFMIEAKGIIIKSKNVETDLVEEYMLRLSNMLYFLGEQLELVGIKEDVAKAARQEIYNNAYLENDVETENYAGKRVKPTKDANQAVAEESSKYESVIHNIYERTYKVIKFKIDAGYEFLSSLKKILNRRVQELSLGMYNPKTNFNMKTENDIGVF